MSSDIVSDGSKVIMCFNLRWLVAEGHGKGKWLGPLLTDSSRERGESNREVQVAMMQEEGGRCSRMVYW